MIASATVHRLNDLWPLAQVFLQQSTDWIPFANNYIHGAGEKEWQFCMTLQKYRSRISTRYLSPLINQVLLTFPGEVLLTLPTLVLLTL